MQFFGTRRTYKTFSTASNSSSKSFASRPVDDNEKTGQPSWYLSRVGFTSRPSESDPSWNNSSALSKIFPSTGDREASFDLWRRNRVCSTWTMTFPSGHQNFLWRSNFFECVVGYSSVRARLRVLSNLYSQSFELYVYYWRNDIRTGEIYRGRSFVWSRLPTRDKVRDPEPLNEVHIWEKWMIDSHPRVAFEFQPTVLHFDIML